MTHGSKTCLEHSCRLQSQSYDIHGRKWGEDHIFFVKKKETRPE